MAEGGVSADVTSADLASAANKNSEILTCEDADTETVDPHPISVCVCTSAPLWNVEGLLNHLTESEDMQKYVEKAELLELPYNGLDEFNPDWKDYSMVLLCHSINNRRFAVTDVLDALYNSFLPKAKDHFGPDKVVVIVHDLDWPIDNLSLIVESFKNQQPMTFECARWVYVCGKLEKEAFQMDETDKKALRDVMKYAFMNPVNNWSPGSFTSWKIWFSDYLRFIIQCLAVNYRKVAPGQSQEVDSKTLTTANGQKTSDSVQNKNSDPEQRTNQQSAQEAVGWFDNWFINWF